MRHLLLLALMIPTACTVRVDTEPPKSYVTKMVIDNGKESILECNTGRWTGRITIAPDVMVDYKNVTTTAPEGAQSKTTLTLNGVLMTVEEDGLRFGSDTHVPLSGESAVGVQSDGVYIKGTKVADLQAK